MIFKRLIFVVILINLFTASLYAQDNSATESDQQINDFSLTGYGDKGKKSWDLSGKSADIFTEVVKLKDVVGNLYGKEEDINLKANRGEFNKVDGKIHLEKDVVITTSSGTKLTTDSLDWDRKNQFVSTKDVVNIVRENMVVVARGARGQPNLKKVALEKDVRLDINPTEEDKDKKGQGPDVKEKIIITCSGPLEIDYEKNIATFNNNVKVDRKDSIIYSDKMDVYFIPAAKTKEKSEDTAAVDKSSAFMGSKIAKIIARGNVKIVQDENISFSEEAIYTASDKKLVLNGKPKLIIYSTEGLNASFGN